MVFALRDYDRHTYGDYCHWPEDVRYELIDGQAYAMAPGRNRQHQEIGFEIARQIADALEGSPCRTYVAPFDVRLPRANEADDDVDTVVQPDISVICDRTKLDDRGCRLAKEMGVKVAISTDAHRAADLDLMRFGVDQARRGWLEPGDVVNTLPLAELKRVLRPAR